MIVYFNRNNFILIRPLCSAQLAVGCALGVAFWTVDPASLGTRPSASCLTHLPHPTSVNTVGWDPQVIFFFSSFIMLLLCYPNYDTVGQIFGFG